uniref:Uncharacterized protein n=1 Tax=Cucumis melo TaxID=3656 RepID=A0A9I9DEC1_CUCME
MAPYLSKTRPYYGKKLFPLLTHYTINQLPALPNFLHKESLFHVFDVVLIAATPVLSLSAVVALVEESASVLLQSKVSPVSTSIDTLRPIYFKEGPQSSRFHIHFPVLSKAFCR